MQTFPKENNDGEILPGRPSAWPNELGLGKDRNARFPLPIWALLKELPVKRLLARMALDPAAKAEILAPYLEDSGSEPK